jgi:hypothetical protein
MGHFPGLSSLTCGSIEQENTFIRLMYYDLRCSCYKLPQQIQSIENLFLLFFHHYFFFMKLPLSTRYCAFSAILSLVQLNNLYKAINFRSGFIRVVLKPFSFEKNLCVPMVTVLVFLSKFR